VINLAEIFFIHLLVIGPIISCRFTYVGSYAKSKHSYFEVIILSKLHSPPILAHTYTRSMRCDITRSPSWHPIGRRRRYTNRTLYAW